MLVDSVLPVREALLDSWIAKGVCHAAAAQQ